LNFNGPFHKSENTKTAQTATGDWEENYTTDKGIMTPETKAG
jgi:hypothetical protein